MSLNILLEAADFIDRREGTTDDMTPTEPSQVTPAPSKTTPKPLYRTIWSRSDEDSQFFREFDGEGGEGRRGTREVHNKLEKNRRAHLKECFELIKSQLPPGQDNKKASHLSILHNAIKYIQVLRRKDREFDHEMEKLAREKIALKQKAAMLKRELSARWDHLDVNTLVPDEPEEITVESPEVKYSKNSRNIPSDGPKMISLTSRLESVQPKPQQAPGHLATALISPVQLVASSSLRVLPRDPSHAVVRDSENGKGRFLTISGGAFHPGLQTAKFKATNQSAGFTHVVAPLATSHGTLITPVTVVSQGTQIAQIITAPSKLVSPFSMKPIMSQYLVKHGSAVVVRNQTSALTQTNSK